MGSLLAPMLELPLVVLSLLLVVPLLPPLMALGLLVAILGLFAAAALATRSA